MKGTGVSDIELMRNLKRSYREVVVERRTSGTFSKIATVRRYLVAISDILDVFLDFNRDRRWRDY